MYTANRLEHKESEKNKDLDPQARTVLVSNLGLLFEQKCERTKALDDIRNAIECCQQALKFAEDSGSNWIAPCMNLGNALLESHFRTNNMEDLARAVEHARKAVGNPSRIEESNPDVLTDAAIILKASFQRTKDPAELHQAAEFMEMSVSQRPAHHIGRASTFFEYGKVLEELYYLAPSQLTMEETIEAYIQAVNCPTGQIMARLGAARSVARLLSSINRWNEASHYLEKAIEHVNNACPRWLAIGDRQYVLSMVHGVPADAAAAALQVSTQNAYKALRSLELSRGIVLGSTMDYRTEAKHLEVVSPGHITEWNHLCMELDALLQEKMTDERTTRHQQISTALSTIIDYIRQIPSFESFSPPLPLGSLRAHDLKMASPELFEAYNALRREFDSLPMEKEGGRLRKRQRELSHQLDGLVTTFRKLPGLEDFLLPPPEKAMLELAHLGPIFVLNCSSLVDRSDAIIIQTSGIEVLPLPLLRYADIQRWMKERDDVVGGWTLRTFPKKNGQMRDMLRWLWQTAAKPILSHLNMLSHETGKEKCRVYWIGTGLLSTAPFHAAGEHEGHSTDNTISHVISSYIPSLRALSFAREEPPREHALSKLNRRLFIADVPSPPGAPPLRAVEAEVGMLVETAAPHATVVRLPSATPAEVLRELPLANMVHFACHAMSDPVDLANSHLLLHSPAPTQATMATTTTGPGKLTVSRISAAHASAAELAYLSACSAAESRKATLADESIHIASAFQLAGFRHVVGTLWQTKDECCREVAEEFYRRLFAMLESQQPAHKNREGEGTQPSMPAAEALHDAVLKVRAENPGKVLAWASFVHFGA
jgi:tetratricopeptide (TPR) repeat protein